MTAGFYWYEDKEQEPRVVHVINIYRHFPKSQSRLEVLFHGTDATSPIEECKGTFTGPLFQPPPQFPEVRERLADWTRGVVETMLADGTCQVTLDAQTTPEQDQITDAWIIPAKRTLRIGVNGGGGPR